MESQLQPAPSERCRAVFPIQFHRLSSSEKKSPQANKPPSDSGGGSPLRQWFNVSSS